MAAKLTIQDIAKLAGVSNSTVSRVLNNKPDVDAATRARVQQVMKEHHYEPNLIASHLAGRQSQIIGVLVPTLPWAGNPVIVEGVVSFLAQGGSQILEGIDGAIDHTPYELLLFSVHQMRTRNDVVKRLLATQLFSGLLVVDPPTQPELILHLYRQGLPVVTIDDKSHELRLPSVGIDNRRSAYMAVSHLIQLGHRRIAFLGGPAELDYQFNRDRYQGYCEALRDANIARDPALERRGNYIVIGGEICARQLFDLAERPSAIFACNDQMAYGVLNVARERGIRIPEEVALVGFDDQAPSATVQPALTTVHQPFLEIGQRALELLITLIEEQRSERRSQSSHDDTVPIRIQLGTHLVVRETCGARAPDKQLAR